VALKKQKELDNGTIGEYWVAQTHNNMQSKKTEVIMLLYKDAQARTDGKSFILRERISDIDGVYLTGERVYTAIKASRMSEAVGVEGDEGYVAPVENNWFNDSEDA
jgi:hypothetical protein